MARKQKPTNRQTPNLDPRSFVRLASEMPEHRKVIGLTDAAFRLHIEGLCWAHRSLTDGFVPQAVVRRLSDMAFAIELVDAGLWEAGEGGWWVHDYLAHQVARSEVEGLSNKRRVSGARGAHTRFHVKGGKPNPSCDLCHEEGLIDPPNLAIV